LGQDHQKRKREHNIGDYSMTDSKRPLTRKDLCEKTGAKYYQVYHYTLAGKLPVLHKSKGKGDETIYAPEAITILQDLLAHK